MTQRLWRGRRTASGKRLTGERVGLVEELRARVMVGEGSDAQTVGGVKLRLQEVAAHLTNVHQLQEAGGRQQNLHKQSGFTTQNGRLLERLNPKT